MTPHKEKINSEISENEQDVDDEPRPQWHRPEVKTLRVVKTVGGSPGTVSESTSMAVGFASTS